MTVSPTRTLRYRRSICTNGSSRRPARPLGGPYVCRQLQRGFDTRYSTYLMAIGRTEEALAEMRKAEELDPLNAAIIADRGNTLIVARRYDEALAQYPQSLSARPRVRAQSQRRHHVSVDG